MLHKFSNIRFSCSQINARSTNKASRVHSISQKVYTMSSIAFYSVVKQYDIVTSTLKYVTLNGVYAYFEELKHGQICEICRYGFQIFLNLKHAKSFTLKNSVNNKKLVFSHFKLHNATRT